jgi:hypothetical protein
MERSSTTVPLPSHAACVEPERCPAVNDLGAPERCPAVNPPRESPERCPAGQDLGSTTWPNDGLGGGRAGGRSNAHQDPARAHRSVWRLCRRGDLARSRSASFDASLETLGRLARFSACHCRRPIRHRVTTSRRVGAKLVRSSIAIGPGDEGSRAPRPAGRA